MDLYYSYLYDIIFFITLALFDNLFDHQKRNEKHEMDDIFISISYRPCNHYLLFCIYDITFILKVSYFDTFYIDKNQKQMYYCISQLIQKRGDVFVGV